MFESTSHAVRMGPATMLTMRYQVWGSPRPRIINHGSNPYCANSFCSAVSAPSTYIKNWTVTAGDVEQLNGFVANLPSNCVCGGSIDMNGISAGTIEQAVPTVSGNNYEVRRSRADISKYTHMCVRKHPPSFICTLSIRVPA